MIRMPVGQDTLILRDDNGDGNAGTGNLGISGSGLERRIYAQQDANGNVISLTLDGAAALERFVYNPYGGAAALTNSFTNTSDSYAWAYRFQGQRLDLNDGLYDFRNRVYDSSTERFLQQDPMRYVDGSNLYQMEGSNPMNRIDPFGTDSGAGRSGLSSGGNGSPVSESGGGAPSGWRAPLPGTNEITGVLGGIWNFIKGIFGADGDKDNCPTGGGTAGGIARDVGIDQGIGRNLNRPGQAAGLGACVTVAQGLDAAGKAFSLLPGISYWREYQRDLEDGKNPDTDPVVQGLDKIRNGRTDELTPLERAEINRRFKIN